MKIGIIGRTEILYNTAVLMKEKGFEIVFILTTKEAPEYTKTSDNFRKLADEWGIPFVHSPRIIEQIDFIRKSGADIGVSLNYSGIIPQSVIDSFPLGILNAHGGDLPRYRGNACQAWAILNGEPRIGLCIHRMIGGELDSGDIIAREYLDIDHNTKVTEIWNWMSEKIPALFSESVDRLKKNSDYVLEKQSTNSREALRCYPRRPEDGRIDWNKKSIDILRLINASNKPYAGAFCNFEGEKFIIWDAELIDDGEIFLAVPGQVTNIGDGFVDVTCGAGKIRINKIEFSGKMINPDEVIKSIRMRLN